VNYAGKWEEPVLEYPQKHRAALLSQRSHSTERQPMVALLAVKTLPPDSGTYDP